MPINRLTSWINLNESIQHTFKSWSVISSALHALMWNQGFLVLPRNIAGTTAQQLLERRPDREGVFRLSAAREERWTDGLRLPVSLSVCLCWTVPRDQTTQRREVLEIYAFVLGMQLWQKRLNKPLVMLNILKANFYILGSCHFTQACRSVDLSCCNIIIVICQSSQHWTAYLVNMLNKYEVYESTNTVLQCFSHDE